MLRRRVGEQLLLGKFNLAFAPGKNITKTLTAGARGYKGFACQDWALLPLQRRGGVVARNILPKGRERRQVDTRNAGGRGGGRAFRRTPP